MHFVIDESVDAPVTRLLREKGFAVFSIAEQMPGVTDEVVLQKALELQALLITQDKDFGELVFRLGKAHYGVILLRLPGIKPFEKSLLTYTIIEAYLEKIAGAFTVIYKDFVKIRKA